MAAPTIHSNTAPAPGLSSTSNANTAIGDLVIVITWERNGAGSATHTIQSGFTQIISHTHNDGSTDGQLSVAYKVATASGANSYQAFTSSVGTDTWTGLLVLDTGTYGLPIKSTSSSQTTNAVPNPPNLTGLDSAVEYLAVAISAWHLGSDLTLTPTAPSGYSLQANVAAADNGDVAWSTLGISAVTSVDPGTYGDNQAPNGTCSITMAVPAVFTAGAVSNVMVTEATTSASTLVGTAMPNAAGDLLVANVCWGTNDRTPTLSDSNGNTWTEIGTHAWNSGSSFLYGSAMFYAYNVAGGSNVITVNYGGAATERAITVTEIYGMMTDADPLDQTNSNVNATADGGANTATSNSITPSADNCILVGGLTALAAPPTITPGTNWTQRNETTVLSSFEQLNQETRLQTTATAMAALWTVSSGADYQARVASFLAPDTAKEIAADGGTYSIVGAAANLEADRIFNADGGTYTITGAAVALNHGLQIVADGGTYSIIGTAAGLTATRQIIASGGSYSIVGADVGLTVARLLTAESGAYSLVGADASLEYGAVTGFTLNADGGTYAIAGASVGLLADHVVTALGGAYSIVGADVSLRITAAVLAAGSGVYTITGAAVTLEHTVPGVSAKTSYMPTFRTRRGR